jgi:hypothetical protein
MSLEPIGMLTFVVGLLCLQLGHIASAATMVLATLFGASAAILLGGANIQPAHLLLGFVAATALTRRREMAGAIDAISLSRPGFWLACLVIYGVVAGVIMPRLLAGTMQIVPLGTSEYANTGSTVPLGPVSSNLTQGIYLASDLICFMMISAVASTRNGFSVIASALVAYAVGNALFGLLDVATFSTGTQWLLDFMRNAKYTLHHEEEVNGLKRIVGSFPEASAYARSTLGALGFTATLWLCGRRSSLNGFLALASLLLVVLSTSSTGLAGAPPLLITVYLTALIRGLPANNKTMSAAVICMPLVIVVAGLTTLLNDGAFAAVSNYVDTLIFSKSTSDSGIERESWNKFALQNFFDSFGMGIGAGTVRTSSLPIALLAGVGIPGTIFYVLFLGSIVMRRRGLPRTFSSDVRLAARNACIGLIFGDTFAAPTIEQGLLFYIFAAVACAEPERAPARLIGPQPLRIEVTR